MRVGWIGSASGRQLQVEKAAELSALAGLSNVFPFSVACRPLHIAARNGLASVVQALLSRGATVLAVDEEGAYASQLGSLADGRGQVQRSLYVASFWAGVAGWGSQTATWTLTWIMSSPPILNIVMLVY